MFTGTVHFLPLTCNFSLSQIQALARAIAICGPGVPINRIGATIHAYADTFGYGVVEAFVGHGVGRDFHSAPTIVHCRNGVKGVMQARQPFCASVCVILTRVCVADAFAPLLVRSAGASICASEIPRRRITP